MRNYWLDKHEHKSVSTFGSNPISWKDDIGFEPNTLDRLVQLYNQGVSLSPNQVIFAACQCKTPNYHSGPCDTEDGQ